MNGFNGKKKADNKKKVNNEKKINDKNGQKIEMERGLVRGTYKTYP